MCWQAYSSHISSAQYATQWEARTAQKHCAKARRAICANGSARQRLRIIIALRLPALCCAGRPSCWAAGGHSQHSLTWRLFQQQAARDVTAMGQPARQAPLCDNPGAFWQAAPCSSGGAVDNLRRPARSSTGVVGTRCPGCLRQPRIGLARRTLGGVESLPAASHRSQTRSSLAVSIHRPTNSPPSAAYTLRPPASLSTRPIAESASAPRDTIQSSVNGLRGPDHKMGLSGYCSKLFSSCCGGASPPAPSPSHEPPLTMHRSLQGRSL